MNEDAARGLWISVLAAALHDAARGKDVAYLESRDFKIACTFAGFDPDEVRENFNPERFRRTMKAMQLRAA